MQYLEHHTAAQIMTHLIRSHQRIGPDSVAHAVHVHRLLDNLVEITAGGTTMTQDQAGSGTHEREGHFNCSHASLLPVIGLP